MAAIIISKEKEKEEPLQLRRQGGESKVFSRLLTRESSAAAPPSFRVYYGVASAGSVPFLWESQPGTPKNDAVSSATLPPLTPPPSYYTAAAAHGLRHRGSGNSNRSSSSSSAAAAGGGKNRNRKLLSRHYISVFTGMIPKMILHRRRSRSTSSAASSCSSSSWSSAFSFSSAASMSFRSAQSSSGAACSSSSMRSRVFAFSASDDGEGDGEGAAAPTMCFSVRGESFRAFRGCRVAMTVKSALASVGGGHAGPTTAAAHKV